jgi:dTMP kinase
MNDKTELLLFAAARAQHVHEKIVPAVNAGKVVICDRFDSATRSFQGYGRGLSLELIGQLNAIALDGFTPDMNIILDLDPEEGMRRVGARGDGYDRMETQQMEFLKRARQGYLIQAKNDPKHYRVIDASQSLEDVLDDVLAVVDQLLDR